MNVLPVSYVSQLLTGALEHNNDCGSASSLMLLRTYNLANEVSVDQFYNSIYPVGDYALSASQMQLRMNSYGLKTVWKVNMTMESCFSSLREEKPILALIHYAPLVDAGLTEKTSFRGSHFLVITGIDLDYIYVNDPYRTDGKKDIAIPHAVFESAWAQCVLDGNPVGGAVIPTLPIQDLSVPIPVSIKYALLVNGLNVRSKPAETSELVKTIWRTVTPYIYCNDSLVNGYRQLADLSGWVFNDYIRKV